MILWFVAFDHLQSVLLFLAVRTSQWPILGPIMKNHLSIFRESLWFHLLKTLLLYKHSYFIQQCLMSWQAVGLNAGLTLEQIYHKCFITENCKRTVWANTSIYNNITVKYSVVSVGTNGCSWRWNDWSQDYYSCEDMWSGHFGHFLYHLYQHLLN